MGSRAFVLALLCVPAFSATISRVEAVAGESCSHPSSCFVSTADLAAGAEVWGTFGGSQPLVSMRLYVYVAPPQYVPWPVLAGTASASASYSFQLVTDAHGTGRVEADLSIYAARGNFWLMLGDTQLYTDPSVRPDFSFSADVLLDQPIAIGFYGGQMLGGGLHHHGSLTSWAYLDAVRVYDANGSLVEARLAAEEGRRTGSGADRPTIYPLRDARRPSLDCR
jgi:hypothetical protein